MANGNEVVAQVTEEVVSHFAYDSGSPGATGLTLTLFTVPLGGGSTPKTLYETNMSDGGKFPTTDSFRVQALRLFLEPDATIAEVVAVGKGELVLEIGNKPYIELPLFSLNAGCGLHLTCGAATLSTVEVGAFGIADQGAVLPFGGRPLVVGEGQTFNVTLTWPVAPGDVTIWVGFDGELHRPIQ